MHIRARLYLFTSFAHSDSSCMPYRENTLLHAGKARRSGQIRYIAVGIDFPPAAPRGNFPLSNERNLRDAFFFPTANRSI